MTSLRNSIHRRNHKERSQLANRSKLGFLEKHKDYVKRAKDYHSKQDKLTRLRQKASERNKDEFYFSMTREKTKGGAHIQDRGNVALPTDVVKVLKTQDENYVRTMRVAGLKKIDKLKAQLTALADLIKPDADIGGNHLEPEEIEALREAGILSGRSMKSKRQHIVFVDDENAARSYAAQSYPSQTHTTSVATSQPIDLGWVDDNKKNPPKKRRSQKDVDMEAEEGDEELDETSATQHRQRLLKELSARLVRDKQMRYAEREFEMQRLMMGKGARKKISAPEKVGNDADSEDDEDALDARAGRPRRKNLVKSDETYKPRVYKWRLERKR